MSITSTTVGPFKDGSFKAGVRVKMNEQTSIIFARQGSFPTRGEASGIAEAFLKYICELVYKALTEVKYEKLIVSVPPRDPSGGS